MPDSASGGADVKLGTVYWDLTIRTQQLQAGAAAVSAAGDAMQPAMDQSAAAIGRVSTQATQSAAALKAQAVAGTQAAAAAGAMAKATDTATGATQKSKLELAQHALAADQSHKALRAVEGGMISMALQATATTGPLGKVVEGLLLFGGGVTGILGVAAAIAVIAKGYDLLTENSRNTAAAVSATNDALDKARQAKDPTADATSNLNVELDHQSDLIDQIATKRKQLATLGDNPESVAIAQQLDDAESDLAQTTQRVADAERAVAAARAASHTSALDTLTQGVRQGISTPQDQQHAANIEAELRAVMADANVPLKERLQIRASLNEYANAELDQEVKQLAAQRSLRDLALDAQEAVAKLTGNLADDAIAALQKFDEQARQHVEDAQIANQRPGAIPTDLRQLQDEQGIIRFGLQSDVTTAQARDFVKSLQDQLAAATAGTGFAGVKTDQLADESALLDVLVQKAQARQAELEASNGLHENDQALIVIHQAILELLRQQTTVSQQQADTISKRAGEVGQQIINGFDQANQKATKAHQATIDLARNISDATRGALELASAFGLVDEATSKILENIADVAGGIPRLVSDIDNIGKTDDKGNPVVSTTELLGAGLTVVGGFASLIGGLFGDSPAEQAREAALEKNSEAIQKLTDTIGELGVANVTGTQFANAQAALNSAAGQSLINAVLTPSGPTGLQFSNLDTFLKQYGTSRTQLQELADSLGLQTNFLSNDFLTIQASFKALDQAIEQTQLTQFAQTFAGQLQALNLKETVAGITDPLQKLKDLLGLLSTPGIGSPALAQALGGIDLSTAQGRQQASSNLASLVLQLQAGTLNPSALGGLTGDELVQEINDIKGLLTSIDQSTANGQTNQYAVQRTVTEETAEQMAGILISIDARLAEANGYLATMAAQAQAWLSQYVLPSTPITPPMLGPGGTASAAGGLVIQQLTIVVGAGVDPQSAQAAGAAAAASFADGVNQALGRQYRTTRATRGDPVRTG